MYAKCDVTLQEHPPPLLSLFSLLSLPSFQFFEPGPCLMRRRCTTGTLATWWPCATGAREIAQASAT